MHSSPRRPLRKGRESRSLSTSLERVCVDSFGKINKKIKRSSSFANHNGTLPFGDLFVRPHPFSSIVSPFSGRKLSSWDLYDPFSTGLKRPIKVERVSGFPTLAQFFATKNPSKAEEKNLDDEELFSPLKRKRVSSSTEVPFAKTTALKMFTDNPQSSPVSTTESLIHHQEEKLPEVETDGRQSGVSSLLNRISSIVVSQDKDTSNTVPCVRKSSLKVTADRTPTKPKTVKFKSKVKTIKIENVSAATVSDESEEQKTAKDKEVLECPRKPIAEGLVQNHGAKYEFTRWGGIFQCEPDTLVESPPKCGFFNFLKERKTPDFPVKLFQFFSRKEKSPPKRSRHLPCTCFSCLPEPPRYAGEDLDGLLKKLAHEARSRYYPKLSPKGLWPDLNGSVALSKNSDPEGIYEELTFPDKEDETHLQKKIVIVETMVEDMENDTKGEIPFSYDSTGAIPKHGPPSAKPYKFQNRPLPSVPTASNSDSVIPSLCHGPIFEQDPTVVYSQPKRFSAPGRFLPEEKKCLAIVVDETDTSRRPNILKTDVVFPSHYDVPRRLNIATERLDMDKSDYVCPSHVATDKPTIPRSGIDCHSNLAAGRHSLPHPGIGNPLYLAPARSKVLKSDIKYPSYLSSTRPHVLQPDIECPSYDVPRRLHNFSNECLSDLAPGRPTVPKPYVKCLPYVDPARPNLYKPVIECPLYDAPKRPNVHNSGNESPPVPKPDIKCPPCLDPARPSICKPGIECPSYEAPNRSNIYKSGNDCPSYLAPARPTVPKPEVKCPAYLDPIRPNGHKFGIDCPSYVAPKRPNMHNSGNDCPSYLAPERPTVPNPDGKCPAYLDPIRPNGHKPGIECPSYDAPERPKIHNSNNNCPSYLATGRSNIDTPDIKCPAPARPSIMSSETVVGYVKMDKTKPANVHNSHSATENANRRRILPQIPSKACRPRSTPSAGSMIREDDEQPKVIIKCRRTYKR